MGLGAQLRRPWLSLATVSAAVLLSGCGGGEVPDRPSETESRAEEQAHARTYFARMAECLTENGVPAEVLEDGEGIEYQSPPGGEGNSEAVYRECSASLGGEPTTAPLTDEEISLVYDELLSVRSCLIEEGFPAVDPPSEQTFIAQYRSAGDDAADTLWSPYPLSGRIVNVDALQACPQKNVFAPK